MGDEYARTAATYEGVVRMPHLFGETRTVPATSDPGQSTVIDTTIIVPTFNEGANVARLVDELATAFDGRRAEILFIDDSTDDTPDYIARAGSLSRIPVRLIHRVGAERVGGLAGAVTSGIQNSSSDFVVVMDGDLQHPPAMAPLLRDAAQDCDLVVASRYCGTGDAGGLNGAYRRMVSSGSTVLAQACFPRRVGRVCSDPMTGFFCFRRSAVDLSRLRPRGFKILLEILARHDLAVQELPFTFGERHAGESKASWRNGLQFAYQMASLRMGRMSRFAAVGALGTVVNLALMALLIHLHAFHYLVAAAIAAEVSILFNFALLERFVFQDLRSGAGTWWRRLGAHVAFNSLEALARLPVLAVLVEFAGMTSLVAQALTLAVAFVLRFLFTSRVIYRAGGRSGAVVLAPTLPQPPDDDERVTYLAATQPRWVFAASALAMVGVAISLGGLALQRYWTLLFLAPLLLLVLEQLLSLRTSTYRREVTLPDHQFLVESWRPQRYPSVDVFLPTAGEDLALLGNTYRYVAELAWAGPLRVHVLDDAARPEVEELAAAHGFGYLARPGSEHKKAGNLQYAFGRTDGDLILILDADFVPRNDMLCDLVPYFDDATVGIVQSPQYFDTGRQLSWLQRCAGVTQELFYRLIQASRDRVGAAICVGTSALYRREALETIGGFPLVGHSEDVWTGVLLGRRGYRLRYVPVIASRGQCPDDVDAFIAQQYRWCEGSMALIADPEFHLDASMSPAQRLSFWSGFIYYGSTALSAVLGPLPVLLMLFVFPQDIASANMFPLLGVLLLWLVILPMTSTARWRPEVLRVQIIYGFAHMFCILDVLNKRTVEWVATGARASRSSIARRVRRFMVTYLAATQVLTLVGLAWGVQRYGLGDFWANVLFAAFSAYVFWPVVIVGLRPGPAAESKPATAAIPAPVRELAEVVT